MGKNDRGNYPKLILPEMGKHEREIDPNQPGTLTADKPATKTAGKP